MEMKNQLYTIILWSESLGKKEEILNNLKESFRIKRIFRFSWQKQSFRDNLISFYAHSQKHLEEVSYKSLLDNKIRHCGNDSFLVIIIEDPNPIFELRKTSSGKRSVNVNVFDKKQFYREITGGGHKVHSSDNFFETNKDLTILFGLNVNDFSEKYSDYDDINIIEYNKNCLGVDGFCSINEFFYLTNNTIQYCVLRNFECLPNKYTIEGHGDIDLLVEDENYMVYLTHAKAIYPEQKNRVHYAVEIENKKIPFDFRYVGDNYLDIKWEFSILKNREFVKNIFYTPNTKDYFYSLIYHAYIQKTQIKADYIPKLNNLGHKLGISYDFKTILPDKAIEILNSYMVENNYEYVLPIDQTVYFKQSILFDLDENESTFGSKISETFSRTESDFFFSKVFERESSFIKKASKEIIQNEVCFLEALRSEPYFPKVLSKDINESFVEISKLDGVLFKTFFSNKRNYSLRNIKAVIYQGLQIFKILIENDILHRDITDKNFIILNTDKQLKLFLFDFGWATAISKKNKAISPNQLGAYFVYEEGKFSDLYSFGALLNYYLGLFPFVKEICSELFLITSEDYNNTDLLLIKLQDIVKKRRSYCFYDYFVLIIYKILAIFRIKGIRSTFIKLKKRILQLFD